MLDLYHIYIVYYEQLISLSWLTLRRGGMYLYGNTPEASWRLPRFSPNSFLSLLLHGFGASAFARNAYG